MPPGSDVHNMPVVLGVDELGPIMQLAAGDSISAKIALAQVSRRWRFTSLTTATVWSEFSVKTLKDALRLPIVLDRARRALLDVSLDFSGRKQVKESGELVWVPTIRLHDRLGIYHDLSPRMPRVRRLAINFGSRTDEIDESEPLGELFSFAIPRMEELSIDWRVFRGRTVTGTDDELPAQLVLPIEAALRLRSVRLVNVIPTDWDEILVPSIETLHLDTSVDDPNLLLRILNRCPRLSSLTFRPTCRTGFGFRGATAAPSAHGSLRSLHLRGAGALFRNMWHVLAPMLNMGALEDVTVTVPEGDTALSAGTVARRILDGLGPLVKTRILGQDSGLDLSVSDAFGRMRRVLIGRTTSDIDHARDFWRELAHSVGGLAAMQSVAFVPQIWFTMGAAIARYPLTHPNVELRIVLGKPGEVDALFLGATNFGFNALPEVECANLRRIVFEVDTEPESKLRVALVMLDNIACAQTAEVCVADSAFRVQWVRRLNGAVRTRPRWVLCTHCSPLVP